jgi:predicted TIM-barrel fold metal-dependent hydrolase
VAIVNFDVPAGACDCHTHIFGDVRQFPFSPARTYTPAPASVEEMRGLHRALRLDRVVIVQPSVYGSDNACTLDGLRQLGSNARGVAVIDDMTAETTLDDMDRAGVRAIRVSLDSAGQTDLAVSRRRFQLAVDRITGREWHIQIYTRLPAIEGIHDQVMASPVPVVFDHFGGAQGTLGVGQAGFEALLNLVRVGKAYVKISAPYRSSTQAPDYPDVAPLASALIAANPQRILWGVTGPTLTRRMWPAAGPPTSRRHIRSMTGASSTSSPSGLPTLLTAKRSWWRIRRAFTDFDGEQGGRPTSVEAVLRSASTRLRNASPSDR